jgi:hypothetical protein
MHKAWVQSPTKKKGEKEKNRERRERERERQREIQVGREYSSVLVYPSLTTFSI